MSLGNVLESEAGLTVVSTVLGALWTFFKSREWYTDSRKQRYAKALDALEAGVDQTYRTYVASIKEASDDGKLTEKERKRARELAREAAVEFGETQGVDVLRELGEGYIDVWISKLVKKLKSS